MEALIGSCQGKLDDFLSTQHHPSGFDIMLDFRNCTWYGHGGQRSGGTSYIVIVRFR